MSEDEYRDLVLRFRTRQKHRSGYPNEVAVYLMQDGEDYKIGFAEGINSRLSHIRDRYPETHIHSYHRVPTGFLRLVESRLHDLFDGQESPSRSWEWFRLTEQDVRSCQAAMMILGTAIRDLGLEEAYG